MVKITHDMILKYASHAKQRSNEPDSQYMRRLTHIYFQERDIDEISSLSACKNLSVLYLYDNNIEVIKNLDFACHLTHLYLQKNNIRRISGLHKLEKLVKLYLGHNAITVVESLEGNRCLSELHVEGQRLPPGEKLLFDPRSLESLSRSLCILNVSGNNLDRLAEFKCLKNMSHFMAEDNKLGDAADLSDALLEWTALSKLDIAGNPLCGKKKYRDKIIIMSRSLVMIDGKEVSESTRQFLKNWNANKETKKQHRDTSKVAGSSFEYVDMNADSRLVLRHPYSHDSISYMRDGRFVDQDVAGSTHKRLSKQHQQFAEVLARARRKSSLVPPLEQRIARAEMAEMMLENRPDALSKVTYGNGGT